MTMTLKERYELTKATTQPATEATSPQTRKSGNKGLRNGDGCCEFIGQRVTVMTANGTFGYVGTIEACYQFTILLRQDNAAKGTLIFKGQILSIEPA